MADVDWTDPCARAPILRAAYYRLLSGEQEWEFSYTAEGVNRHIRYSQVDLKLLQAELRAAETECAAKSGTADPRRRFAISAGSRRFV